MEYKATLTPNRRSRLTYLINHTWRIQDPYTEFYHKITIGVPTPRSADDKPAILVKLHNAHRSLLMRFSNVEDLCRVFALANNFRAELEDALINATQMWIIRREVQKEADKEILSFKSNK